MISLELSSIQAKGIERAALASAADHFLRAGGCVVELPPVTLRPPQLRYHPETVKREPVRRIKQQKPKRKPVPSPHQARRLELLPQIIEMAKTMTAPEVSRETNIARTTLRALAAANGFEFFVLPRPGPASAQEVEELKRLADDHSVAEVGRLTGRGRRNLLTIAKNGGFKYRSDADKGAKNIDRSMTPQQIAKHAERLQAYAAIGITKAKAAGLCGIGYQRFLSICKDFGIEFGGKP